MKESRARVLLIDDEPQMRRLLRTTLSSHGYDLVEAATGEEGVRQAESYSPEVILLDLGLPDLDGVEVARRIRGWSATPIVVLSARGQETDKIAALDAGADDYLTKPFGTGELLARIRVALRHTARRSAEGAEEIFTVEDLKVDVLGRRVFTGDREVHLTRTEFKLLTVLVRNAGRVLTHKQLLVEVWGPPFSTQTHYLRVYMAQLRTKLEHEPARPRYLVTEPGVGYRLRVE